MAKFGELIDLKVPVLIDFYRKNEQKAATDSGILKDVAAELGARAKIVKIDVDQNKKLSEALQIKDLPTLVLYKNGEMVWRHSGAQDAQSLIALVQKYA